MFISSSAFGNTYATQEWYSWVPGAGDGILTRQPNCLLGAFLSTIRFISIVRLLGLDISLTATGVAALDGKKLIHSELINTFKEDEDIVRFGQILKRIQRCVQEDNIEAVGIEGYAYFMGSKGNCLTRTAECNGILKHWLHSINIPYYLVPPTAHKKFITGKGNATKEETIAAIAKLYPELPKPTNKKEVAALSNLADAVSIVLWLENKLKGPVTLQETGARRSLSPPH